MKTGIFLYVNFRIKIPDNFHIAIWINTFEICGKKATSKLCWSEVWHIIRNNLSVHTVLVFLIYISSLNILSWNRYDICAFQSSSSVQICKVIEPLIAEIMKFFTLTSFLVFIVITYGDKLDEDITEKLIGKYYIYIHILYIRLRGNMGCIRTERSTPINC